MHVSLLCITLTLEFDVLGPCKDTGGTHPLFFEGGETPRVDSFTNQSDRNATIQRINRRPFARALLPGGVKNLRHQRLAIAVFVSQDISSDFNQVRVQIALVP